MKTLIKRSFFILGSFLVITTLHAQSVDDIIGKYIDAVGGKTVLGNIKSLTIENSIDVAGQEAPNTTYILVGKGFKSQTDIQGMKMVQSVTPDGAWMDVPGGSGATALPADQAKTMTSQMDIPNSLPYYAARGFKVELTGKDTADYKLKMTLPSATATYYINMKTYLIDKEVDNATTNGQEVESTRSFSDYKKTDFGYVMAYTQTLELPQITLTITTKKVTVNGTIDPAIFAMPK
jgi:hypothetical protein